MYSFHNRNELIGRWNSIQMTSNTSCVCDISVPQSLQAKITTLLISQSAEHRRQLDYLKKRVGSWEVNDQRPLRDGDGSPTSHFLFLHHCPALLCDWNLLIFTGIECEHKFLFLLRNWRLPLVLFILCLYFDMTPKGTGNLLSQRGGGLVWRTPHVVAFSFLYQ